MFGDDFISIFKSLCAFGDKVKPFDGSKHLRVVNLSPA